MRIKKIFVIKRQVFYTSMLLILVSLLLCFWFHNAMDKWFAVIQHMISESLGWFFILTVNIILVVCLVLAFGRYGSIRLGGEQAVPEFSTASWFAMLFGAGMGIGIMFFSIAEPVSHFVKHPWQANRPADAAQRAMDFTFLHWGLHAWGVYALVGLAIAFFSLNKNLPPTFRSLFFPFLGERIYGWWGHCIDVLSVVATLFGLSTSLGLGVQQMNAGMTMLFGWPAIIELQFLLIFIITIIATIAVVLGLDKGVKVLSNINMMLAFTIMLIVFLLGPSVYLLKSFVQNTGSYIGRIIQLCTWNDSYEQTGWQNKWTLFYWAWWIAWCPFVGSFIARISKGRTVKEFILGVLIMPTLITFLWMTVFGSFAISFILHGDNTLVLAVQKDISTALFVFIRQLPVAPLVSFLLSLIAVLLISFFFITSSDSGSLVIDNITSGCAPKTPVMQKIFWTFLQGIVAAVLLLCGGLQALQTAVIIVGLPFAVILLLMAYSLCYGLAEEEGLQRKMRQRRKKRVGHRTT